MAKSARALLCWGSYSLQPAWRLSCWCHEGPRVEKPGHVKPLITITRLSWLIPSWGDCIGVYRVKRRAPVDLVNYHVTAQVRIVNAGRRRQRYCCASCLRRASINCQNVTGQLPWSTSSIWNGALKTASCQRWWKPGITGADPAFFNLLSDVAMVPDVG